MVRRGAVLSGAPSYDKIQNIGQVREKPETLSLNCLHNIVLLKNSGSTRGTAVPDYGTGLSAAGYISVDRG